MTWLNAMNDRGMGARRQDRVGDGAGLPAHDRRHLRPGRRPPPEIVVTDTGSYSDVVFGLLELLGISYRPALADLPDQKGWHPGQLGIHSGA